MTSHGHSAIDTIGAAVRKEAVSTNHEEPRNADGGHDSQDPAARSQRGLPAGLGRANARVAVPWACALVMAGLDRLKFAPVEGAAALFPSAFADYLVRLHHAFTPRVHAIRPQRDVVLRPPLEPGPPPAPPPPTT